MLAIWMNVVKPVLIGECLGSSGGEHLGNTTKLLTCTTVAKLFSIRSARLVGCVYQTFDVCPPLLAS